MFDFFVKKSLFGSSKVEKSRPRIWSWALSLEFVRPLSHPEKLSYVAQRLFDKTRQVFFRFYEFRLKIRQIGFFQKRETV